MTYIAAFLCGVLIGAIVAALVYHNNAVAAEDLIKQLQDDAKKV